MILFKHQQKLLDRFPKKWLLAWGTGTGKSLASLELAKKNGGSALIICPKSIKEQWMSIIKDNNCDYAVLSKEEFKKAVMIDKIESYDNLITDEVHFFSGMQGLKKKSGMLKAMLFYIKKYNPSSIYLLTATPYLSSPWNIYALAEILGHKWNYMAYKNLFFQDVNMGRRWPIPVVKKKVKYKGILMNTEEAVADLVSIIGNTVALEDCADVPEQIFQTEYFDLTGEQKEAIKGLGEVNPIVYWTKCHQICGGTLKSDGYSEDKFYKSDKLNRLLELCDEHKKLIIVCRYNNEIEYIKKQIQIRKKTANIYTINGSTKDKHKVIKSADSSEEAIVISNASCSEGYELPSFPIMIFYSYDFSLKNYIQILGRIQRINNIKKNVYLSLIVKKSIDEEVYKSILRKEDFQIAIYAEERSKIYDRVAEMDEA